MSIEKNTQASKKRKLNESSDPDRKVVPNSTDGSSSSDVDAKMTNKQTIVFDRIVTIETSDTTIKIAQSWLMDFQLFAEFFKGHDDEEPIVIIEDKGEHVKDLLKFIRNNTFVPRNKTKILQLMQDFGYKQDLLTNIFQKLDDFKYIPSTNFSYFKPAMMKYLQSKQVRRMCDIGTKEKYMQIVEAFPDHVKVELFTYFLKNEPARDHFRDIDYE